MQWCRKKKKKKAKQTDKTKNKKGKGKKKINKVTIIHSQQQHQQHIFARYSSFRQKTHLPLTCRSAQLDAVRALG